ncbi:cupin domain-containing protein [Brucella sp. 2716]|uniref:cupin domain-containing protein n=1 Tax=Brucella sp. 2716 TaxID=2975052 RepID=UPI00217E7087|nr:cupin domain-containing protein [Brucella sp. 2716]UWF60386.1 cupin domain-containing protein [Brucella sp. 2716]
MRGAQIISGLMNNASALDTLPWERYKQPGREGVLIHKLYDTGDTGEGGPAAALVRYEPGAKVQKHIHPGYELIFVLEGELINDAGRHPAGTLEICPPGSGHALASEKGCTFLVVWEQPVRLADARVPEIPDACHLLNIGSGCSARCVMN